MNSMRNFKNNNRLFTILILLVAVFTLSSCNRGGYGCPNELQLAFDLLSFIK